LTTNTDNHPFVQSIEGRAPKKAATNTFLQHCDELKKKATPKKTKVATEATPTG
jgi:hypothetical protein